MLLFLLCLVFLLTFTRPKEERSFQLLTLQKTALIYSLSYATSNYTNPSDIKKARCVMEFIESIKSEEYIGLFRDLLTQQPYIPLEQFLRGCLYVGDPHSELWQSIDFILEDLIKRKFTEKKSGELNSKLSRLMREAVNKYEQFGRNIEIDFKKLYESRELVVIRSEKYEEYDTI